jgi:glycosyl transferase family 25
MKNPKIDFICINVASNQKRYLHMQNMAQKCNIPLSFFKAITPDTLHTVANKYNPHNTRVWWRRALIPTEIACGLSHIQLWRNFLNSDSDYLVVFEDDVFIEPDFMDLIHTLTHDDEAYEFIKLSGWKKSPKRKIKDIGVNNYALYLNAYGTLNTACYMINKKGTKKLADYCQTLHSAIDIIMDKSFTHGVKYHTVQPYPIESHWTDTGDLASQISIEERQKLKHDHDNLFLKIAFRLRRFQTTVQKRIATLKLFLDFGYRKTV